MQIIIPEATDAEVFRVRMHRLASETNLVRVVPPGVLYTRHGGHFAKTHYYRSGDSMAQETDRAVNGEVLAMMRAKTATARTSDLRTLVHTATQVLRDVRDLHGLASRPGDRQPCVEFMVPASIRCHVVVSPWIRGVDMFIATSVGARSLTDLSGPWSQYAVQSTGHRLGLSSTVIDALVQWIGPPSANLRSPCGVSDTRNSLRTDDLWLDSGPPRCRWFRNAFLQILAAVDHMHRCMRICHGDLALQNVMLRGVDGSKCCVCLVDFGFSKPVEASGKWSHPRREYRVGRGGDTVIGVDVGAIGKMLLFMSENRRLVTRRG